MGKTKFVRIALLLSGLIAVGIGSALLVFPVSFEASAGIVLDQNISLLSEIRAYGSMVLASGIVMLLGAFFKTLLQLSIGLSSMVYLSIGLARLLNLFIDGIPAQALVAATVAEILIGLVSLFMFLKTRKEKPVKSWHIRGLFNA